MAPRFFARWLRACRGRARRPEDPRDLPAFFHRSHLRKKPHNRKMIQQVLRNKASEADRWVGLQERGTPASLEVIAWIAVRLGRGVARLLLYPVILYFVGTADAARRASYEFLARVRGRSVHWW